MRIVDLTDGIADATELLQSAATLPVRYMESCSDLAPEEVCRHISGLMQLARLAATLAELATDTLVERTSDES